MQLSDAFDQIDVNKDGKLTKREGKAFINQMIPEEQTWEECFGRNHIIGALMHYSTFFNNDGEKGLSKDEFREYYEALSKEPEHAEG